MTLGFSVEELLPRARGGGPLKMALSVLREDEWLQPEPDLALRAAGFDAYPEAVQLLPEAEAPARELATLLGVSGGLEQAARSVWEDLCVLTRREGERVYRLVGAAVAFPTDWRPADKLGLPLGALHKPIHGYEEQLATGVDQFMAKLQPGKVFGRCNWFVAPTDDLRWVGQPPELAFAHVTAENAGETLFVRSERQTLRKLPGTSAVVFTIGVYLAPLGSLSADNVARLTQAVTTIPEPEARRRGTRFFTDAMRGFALRHAAAIDRPVAKLEERAG